MIEDFKKKAVQEEVELAEFVKLLAREGVKSYAEIGSKWGGTVWRVARALSKRSRVVAVDLPNQMGGSPGSEETLADCIRQLNGLGYDAHLVLGNSQADSTVQAVRELGPFDAIFIDADHSLHGVTKDWHAYGPMARIVAFHDIRNPGRHNINVLPLWNEIKSKYRHCEFAISKKYCGIGVLWRE